MRIDRGPDPERYLKVDNRLLRDSRISDRARGLLLRALSYPDGWDADSTWLASGTKEGRKAVQAANRELEAAGYRTTKQVPVPGKRGGVTWETQVTYRAMPEGGWPDDTERREPGTPPEGQKRTRGEDGVYTKAQVGPTTRKGSPGGSDHVPPARKGPPGRPAETAGGEVPYAPPEDQEPDRREPGPLTEERDEERIQAAAGGTIDQREEGKGYADAYGAAARVLAAANLGPSWQAAVTGAIEAGHGERVVLDELTRPRPGARNLDAVRRRALHDLAGTRPAGATPAPAQQLPEPPQEGPPARTIPNLPRLRPGSDPTSLAATVAALHTAADPVGHALGIINGTSATTTADHGHPDPAQICDRCGTRLPRDAKPWPDDTGTFVLYCPPCNNIVTSRRRTTAGKEPT